MHHTRYSPPIRREQNARFLSGTKRIDHLFGGRGDAAFAASTASLSTWAGTIAAFDAPKLRLQPRNVLLRGHHLSERIFKRWQSGIMKTVGKRGRSCCWRLIDVDVDVNAGNEVDRGDFGERRRGRVWSVRFWCVVATFSLESSVLRRRSHAYVVVRKIVVKSVNGARGSEGVSATISTTPRIHHGIKSYVIVGSHHHALAGC